MVHKTYLSFDNGVTGSIGIVGDDLEPEFYITPVFKSLNYTKKVGWTTRIDTVKLLELLSSYTIDVFAVIERPLANPKMWKASVSAMRSMEATIITFEQLAIPYEFVDSKKWQKSMLGSGIKGSKALKEASLQTGIRLFPQFKDMFIKHGDADGILIGEYYRRIKF